MPAAGFDHKTAERTLAMSLFAHSPAILQRALPTYAGLGGDKVVGTRFIKAIVGLPLIGIIGNPAAIISRTLAAT